MLKRMAICPTFSKPKLHNTKSFKKPQHKQKYPLSKSRSQSNLTNPSIPLKPPTNKNEPKQPKQAQLSSSFLNDSSCTKASTKLAINNDQSDILLIKKSPSYGLIHTNAHKPKSKPNPQKDALNLNSSNSLPLKRSNSMILRNNDSNNLLKQYPVSKLVSNRNNLSNSICSSQPNNMRLDTTTATYKSFCK